MSSVHPKIQVESKHDIIFLIKELESSAKTIPGYDAVNTDISLWIKDIFKMASGNIQINGLEYDEAFKETIEYETLDESLRSKVASASELVAQLTLQVTQLRQRIPQEIRESVEEESNAFLKVLSDPITNDAEFKELCIGNGIDWNGLEQSVKESSQILECRSQSIPAMVQKLQRASQVLETLEIPNVSHDVDIKDQVCDAPFTPKKGTNSTESRQKLLSTLTNG